MSLESENRTKLQQFFAEEYRSLKGYVQSRIRDTANRDAEDIIQDVALKLFSGAERYAPINNVAAFVYKSVKNSIIDIMRSPKSVEEAEIKLEFSNLSDLLSGAGNTEPTEEMMGLLKKSIYELKPEYRFIIRAIDFEGYSYRQLADKTGIPQGTLMSRRHRALGILYKKLKNDTNHFKH